MHASRSRSLELACGIMCTVMAAALLAAMDASGALAATIVPVPAKTPTAPAVTATASPAEQKAALMAEAAPGKLTDPLISHFKDFVAAVAKQKLVPAEVSEEFWTWLAANRDFRDPLLVYTFPTFDAGPYKSLAALRAKFGDQVKDFSQLALAMSLVYGRAGSESVREPAVGFAAKDRPVPSLEESFGWYVKNERVMKLPLKATPLPLMVYVADNDLPLDERDWALKRYANLQPNGYAKVYYEVPYDDTKVNGPGKLGDKPVTLANILLYGGVCMHRAYYTSRVLKSFGVPSLYDRGEGERGGHAWVAWVGQDKQNVTLLYSGRFDYDHYYTGQVFDPAYRRAILDRNVELDAAAVARSCPTYFDAYVACYLFLMTDKDKAAGEIGLLDDAVRRNSFCDKPWRVVAMYCADGNIPQTQGERMYDGMLKSFAAYPDLTFAVLQKILQPRLKADSPPATEVAANLQLLERAFQVYDAAKRPDLAVRLRGLQGQYMEAVGRRDDALKLYATNSEKYAALHYGFLDLFDRAVKIMQDDKKQDLLLKYLALMAPAVPEYQSDLYKKSGIQNPAWIHVVKTYASALRDAGKTTDATVWDAKVLKKKTE